MKPNGHRVLVVDDHPGQRQGLREGLRLYCAQQTPPLCWEFDEAINRDHARRLLEGAKDSGGRFAVVVTDLLMDNDPENGLKLIRDVAELDPLAMCILYTAQPGLLDRTDTSELGVFHEIAKGSKPDVWMNKRIFERVRAAIEFREKMVKEAVLSQFFTRRMVDRLVEEPALLNPQRREVTILFCDVRKFSSHSNRLEALGFTKPFEWIRDVMEELSKCVVDQHGEIIDFIGDELMAIWGAPEDQPDHARRACAAALAMLEALPGLQEKWEGDLGERMDFGIGLDSGAVLVGNTGPSQRSKYGVLGTAVNMASRVQGATKHLLTRLLLTENTYQGLRDLQSKARKVCAVEVRGIEGAVNLYDLEGEARPEVLTAYAEALGDFESGRYREAAEKVSPLVGRTHKDGPSVVLLLRALQAIRDGREPKHPTFVLPSK